MGSISSRPPAPTTRVVYVQQPATTTPSVSSASEQDTGPSQEEVAAQSRRENLLRRSRGRFGTVLSGFRGVFTSQGNSTGKTLLGE